MSSFRGFVIKEIRHIIRDRRTMLILFGMPIVQLILFGFVIRNEIENVKIGIVDQAGDHVSMAVRNRIVASPYFTPEFETTSFESVESAFQAGKIKLAVVIEPRFATRLARDGHATIRLIADATDPNGARTILAYASAIIADYQRENLGATQIGVIPETRMQYNPSLKSVFLFVPGIMALILMLVSALMTSVTITREKEMGTMEVLLVSPLRPIQIIIGKVLPYLFLSFVNVLTILGIAQVLFAVPVRGSLALLLAICLLFIVCALSLGVLISARSTTQQTATMISLAGLLLPTVILSGFIFPISSMPTALQIISHIVPAKWFLIAVRGIMLKGVGIVELWQPVAIIAAMTVVLLGASVKNFKIRLE
jgi:ABC-2 type transport system permease protein